MSRSLSKWLMSGKSLGGRKHRSTYKKTRMAGLCDVFINHRSMDTKHTIAGLLYDRLIQLKLNPFLDSKSMKPGDELMKNIENGIRECKVGVAIFSPTYCRSYYCLHELALMTEHQKKIIPIFYDVNPSDLVLVDDGTYSIDDLDRYRWGLELAKRRVGLPFDSCNGDWQGLLNKVSDSVVESLLEMDVEGKSLGHQEQHKPKVWSIKSNTNPTSLHVKQSTKDAYMYE